MYRSLLLTLLTLLFAASSFAQATAADRSTSPATTPVLRDGKLPAGKTLTDSKGREIHNGGSNENGKVHFRYSGKLKTKPNGDIECSGEVTEVTNPASQGSEGPISVNTDGEPTTINLEKNGTDPGGHIVSNITGGNATVNVSGNFNDPTVGGTGNTVNVTGNNNSGSGAAPNPNPSGGNVNQGGHGNSWNSNGGNWVVRN